MCPVKVKEEISKKPHTNVDLEIIVSSELDDVDVVMPNLIYHIK